MDIGVWLDKNFKLLIGVLAKEGTRGTERQRGIREGGG